MMADNPHVHFLAEAAAMTGKVLSVAVTTPMGFHQGRTACDFRAHTAP
jgi:hypothetical protein